MTTEDYTLSLEEELEIEDIVNKAGRAHSRGEQRFRHDCTKATIATKYLRPRIELELPDCNVHIECLSRYSSAVVVTVTFSK